MFWQFFTAFSLFMPKSKLLPSLFIKEQNSDLFFGKEGLTISLFRSQKTSDSLKKPKSEFPTLGIILMH